MKTPHFWYQPSSHLTMLLSPLTFVYDNFRRKKISSSQKSVTCPVLSVGNVTAGGAGKTPVCIMLIELIKQAQLALSPYVITSGHGGIIKGTELIEPETPAYIAGDEALLLTAHAPVIVSKNRLNGAEYAQHLGADLIILDDGLQNKFLKPSLSFCVVDGDYGFGNGQLLPAGPLREPLDEAFERIDAVIIIGDDKHNHQSTLPPSLQVFHARLIAQTAHIDKNLNYIGFCGIALPEKFFKTAAANNINIIDREVFADHYPYTKMDIVRLTQKAIDKNARLLTTSKDMIKIKSITDDVSLFDVLPISIQADDPLKLLDFIKDRIITC